MLQQRTTEILDAAAPLFAQHGFQGLDLQMVANALGIGKGTIYRAFPSKQALFLATVDRTIQRLHDHVEASRSRVIDALDRIEAAVEAHLAFFDEHPECVELLMQERAAFKDRKKPTYFEHREKEIDRWRRLFTHLIAEGRVRSMPVDQITSVLSSLVYGTMFTNYFAGRERSLAAQARELMDILLMGVLSEGERRRRFSAQANE